jgi:hypothetical protein
MYSYFEMPETFFDNLRYENNFVKTFLILILTGIIVGLTSNVFQLFSNFWPTFLSSFFVSIAGILAISFAYNLVMKIILKSGNLKGCINSFAYPLFILSIGFLFSSLLILIPSLGNLFAIIILSFSLIISVSLTFLALMRNYDESFIHVFLVFLIINVLPALGSLLINFISLMGV